MIAKMRKLYQLENEKYLINYRSGISRLGFKNYFILGKGLAAHVAVCMVDSLSGRWEGSLLERTPSPSRWLL